MEVTYYTKSPETGVLIASFGVSIPEWHMHIRNLSILRSKQGGWYIALPSYKDKAADKWEKTLEFDKPEQERFLRFARDAVETYAKTIGEVIA